MAGNTVNILIKADDQASKAIEGVGGSLKRVGEIAAGFLAANVIGDGIGKLQGFFADSVSAASDLGESLNAVSVVFGESAQKVLDWGDTNATAFGLSQRAFNQMATPLGAMLKNTGMDMDSVADNTIKLTERASDMASVFNTDVEDALTAIQAALRGESDPIERYGVSLSAAKVEARALADTGKDTASALTDQEKAAARLALLFEQTDAVAGDFANTSGELANKTRIQAAETEELQAKIGQKLIPVQAKINDLKFAAVQIIADKLLPAMDQMSAFISSTVVPAWESLTEKVGGAIAVVRDQLAPAFDSISSAVQPAIDAIGEFVGSERQDLLKAIGIVIGTVLVGAFAALAVAAGSAAIAVVVAMAPVVAITAAVGALAFGIVKLIEHWDDITARFPIIGQGFDMVREAASAVTDWFNTRLVPALQEAREKFVNDVLPALENVGTALTTLGELIIDFIQAYFTPLREALEIVVTAFRDNFDSIQEVVESVFGYVAQIIENQLELIRDTISIVLALIRGDWEGAWEGVKTLLSNVWENIQETVRAGVELVKATLGAFVAIGGDIIGGLLRGAQDQMGQLINWFFGLPGMIVSQIPNPLDVLWSIGKQIMTGLLNGIVSGWNAVAGFVSSVAGKIASLKGPIEKDRKLLIPQGNAIMQGLEEGISRGFAVNVAPTLQHITNAGIPSAAAGGSAVPAAPVGGGGNVYHINVQALDGRGAAELVLQALVQLERRGGVTPGVTRALA